MLVRVSRYQLSLEPRRLHIMSSRLHHYVAQLTLRRFTDSDGQFWVYDRKNNSYRLAQPSGTAAESEFYSIPNDDGTYNRAVEEFLGAEIETAAGAAIAHLIDGHTLNSGGKTALSRYMAYQHTRVPAYRRGVNEMQAGFARAILGDTPEPTQTLSDQEVRDEATRERERVISQMRYMGEGTAELLQSQYWQLWHATTSGFIITDNPFIHFPSPELIEAGGAYGLETPGIMKLMPISRNWCVLIGDQAQLPTLPEIEVREVGRLEVREINTILAAESERWVIARDRAQLESIVKEAELRGSDPMRRSVYS